MRTTCLHTYNLLREKNISSRNILSTYLVYFLMFVIMYKFFIFRCETWKLMTEFYEKYSLLIFGVIWY